MKEIIIPVVIIGLIIAGLIAGVYFLFNFDTNQETRPIASTTEEEKNNKETMENNIKVTLQTNQGDIVLELFSEKTPKTVANFVKLAESGFYDGTKFHRVIKRFMIQGGDPKSKDDSLKNEWGTGGPGYTFEDEIGEDNDNAIGTIAMANAGPNTNGSQFFINTADNDFLNGKHTVFGKVVSGMENVSKIENINTGENDRPLEDMIINKVIIEK